MQIMYTWLGGDSRQRRGNAERIASGHIWLHGGITHLTLTASGSRMLSKWFVAQPNCK